jgi:hypothetical protein
MLKQQKAAVINHLSVTFTNHYKALYCNGFQTFAFCHKAVVFTQQITDLK